MSQALTRAAQAFLAGSLTVLIVHQPLVAAAVASGLAPPVWVAWAMDPVPPFEIPTLVSRMFWGGVWAIAIDLALGARGNGSWLAWLVAAALAPTLAAIYVVPVLKGGEPLDFWSRFPAAALVNGLWGIAIALVLRVLRRR